MMERAPRSWPRRAALALGLFGAAIVIMWGGYARLGGASADEAGRPPLRGAMQSFVLLPAPAAVPAISFVDRDEKPRSLEDFHGKIVLLNFWATWCAPCVKEMPSLERLQATLGDDKFVVLPLSQDRPGLKLVQKFYQDHDLKGLDIWVDKTSASGRSFKLRGLPTTVLLDGEGREIGRLEGAADWSSPDALALMRHYLPKRTAPPTTSTQAPPAPTDKAG